MAVILMGDVFKLSDEIIFETFPVYAGIGVLIGVIELIMVIIAWAYIVQIRREGRA